MCVTIICPDPCRYLTPQVWVLAVLARDVDQVGGAGMKLAERMYEDIYKYEVHLVKLTEKNKFQKNRDSRSLFHSLCRLWVNHWNMHDRLPEVANVILV